MNFEPGARVRIVRRRYDAVTGEPLPLHKEGVVYGIIAEPERRRPGRILAAVFEPWRSTFGQSRCIGRDDITGCEIKLLAEIEPYDPERSGDTHIGPSNATDRVQRKGLYLAMIYGPYFEHKCPACAPLENPTDDERARIAQWWRWEEEDLKEGLGPSCPRSSK